MQESNYYNWIFLILVLSGAAWMFYRNASKGRRLEQQYREALLNLRRNRHSPEARQQASRSGAAYYGWQHNDGKPTIFDREQMAKEIQEATGEFLNRERPADPANKPITRAASEYRNIR